MKRTLLIALPLALAAGPALADLAMAKKYGCTACHSIDKKVVGPAYADVAKKYQGVKDAEAQLIKHIHDGGSGRWGAVPMPPQASVPAADIKSLAKWILGGAK